MWFAKQHICPSPILSQWIELTWSHEGSADVDILGVSLHWRWYRQSHAHGGQRMDSFVSTAGKFSLYHSIFQVFRNGILKGAGFFSGSAVCWWSKFSSYRCNNILDCPLDFKVHFIQSCMLWIICARSCKVLSKCLHFSQISGSLASCAVFWGKEVSADWQRLDQDHAATWQQVLHSLKGFPKVRPPQQGLERATSN